MNVQFTARHFNASEELQHNIVSMVEGLTKYYEDIISAHVILDAEDKNRRKAEIILNTKGKDIAGKGTGEKMGIAIDSAISKIERQLKKIHDKVKNHRDKKGKEQVN